MSDEERRRKAKAQKALERDARRARADGRLAAYDTRPTLLGRHAEPRVTSGLARRLDPKDDTKPITAKQAIEASALLAEFVQREEEVAALTRQRAAVELALAVDLVAEAERVIRRRLDQCLTYWIVLAEEPETSRGVSLGDIYRRIVESRRLMVVVPQPASVPRAKKRLEVLRQRRVEADLLVDALDQIKGMTFGSVSARGRHARYEAIDKTESGVGQLESWPSRRLEARAATAMSALRQVLLERVAASRPEPTAVDRFAPEGCLHGATYGACMYVTCPSHPLGGLSMDAD